MTTAEEAGRLRRTHARTTRRGTPDVHGSATCEQATRRTYTPMLYHLGRETCALCARAAALSTALEERMSSRRPRSWGAVGRRCDLLAMSVQG
mmetsp:Transcript_50531/g.107910  ORF Transcript_50531/g.107910 Transcript_50531/m.107910 type:complete len:93 (-) Transcript_50531:87-365(-)